MPDRNAAIILQLKADQLVAQSGAAARSMNVLTKEEMAAEQQTLALAQSMARLDASLKNPAGGAQRLRDALSGSAFVTQQHAAAIQTQIASLDNQAAKLASGANLATQFGDAFKSSLLGVVGPAALVTTAIGALVGTAQSFKEAFQFKAQLDADNASIAILLRGVRDTGQAFNEAHAFAAKYKLTQQETTEAISESIPVIRKSTSSVEDILGVFTRLTILKPGKSFADASRAIGELQSGQLVSLEKIFNVMPADAQKMAAEIRGGADAVQVLSRYLTDAGVGMDALKVRTEGATGALNDAKVAEEQLKIAQGEFAKGPGVIITETYTGLIQILTNALTSGADAQKVFNAAIKEQPPQPGGGGGGSFVLKEDIAQQIALAERVGGAFDDERSKLGALQVALGTSEGAIRRNAESSALDAAKKDVQSAATIKVAFETKNAADAFLRLNPNLDASQAFAAAAAQGLGPLVAQVIALRLEADKTRAALLGAKLQGQTGAELTGPLSEAAGLRGDLRQGKIDERNAGIAKAQADARAADAARTEQLLRTGTAAQIVTQRQKEYNDAVKQFGAGSDKAINAQTTLIEAQNRQRDEGLRGVKAHTSELGKQLTTQEGIYDSINKQKQAQLDIEELTIKGRQEDRDAAVKDRTAQRLINALGGRTDARAQDFRGRAEDVIALDDVEKRKRAFELDQKRATAGGAIVNGRVLQSRPGDGSTPQQVGPITPVGAGLPSAPAAGGAAGGGPTVTFILTDIAGAILAKATGPYIMDDLLEGVQSVKISKGA